MAYKDKDRQREAVRLAVRRHRAKQVIPCNTLKDVIPDVIPVKTKFEPEPLDSVRPVTEVDKRCQAKQDTVILEAAGLPPEPQSYNPMMVGYVPPKE